MSQEAAARETAEAALRAAMATLELQALKDAIGEHTAAIDEHAAGSQVLRDARRLRDRLSEQQRAAAKKEREQAKREKKQREAAERARHEAEDLRQRAEAAEELAETLLQSGSSAAGPSSSDGTAVVTGTAVGTDEQNQSRCVICEDAPKDTAFNPCGHVVCAQCAEQVATCPFCMGLIESRIRLYA